MLTRFRPPSSYPPGEQYRYNPPPQVRMVTDWEAKEMYAKARLVANSWSGRQTWYAYAAAQEAWTLGWWLAWTTVCRKLHMPTPIYKHMRMYDAGRVTRPRLGALKGGVPYWDRPWIRWAVTTAPLWGLVLAYWLLAA